MLVDLNSGATSCPYTEELGDGFCDDLANIEECQYDGGDCCSLQKEFKPNAHLFCQNCTCVSNPNLVKDQEQRKAGKPI